MPEIRLGDRFRVVSVTMGENSTDFVLAREQATCKNCGEPELLGLSDSGDFGWFTDYQGKTWCNRCGLNPERKARKRTAVR